MSYLTANNKEALEVLEAQREEFKRWEIKEMGMRWRCSRTRMPLGNAFRDAEYERIKSTFVFMDFLSKEQAEDYVASCAVVAGLNHFLKMRDKK